ncbi:hypothetical protein Cgig2_013738 [Carnegiea gigantea]|uniref:Putative GTP diphosphokinase RSH1, chloroplastic n=1 Tax=Carnegiea gigantea TaxID=171969 RepID=A0A9Q1Q8K5_9CARY|nr:hypothetical protein Cgig2_013738 [Carnegiea gigantea]
MASAPSLSVSVECVSICKLKLWRYDCSVLSCAWRAPRALTGSLASTTQSSSCSTSASSSRPRTRINREKYELDLDLDNSHIMQDAVLTILCLSQSSQVQLLKDGSGVLLLSVLDHLTMSHLRVCGSCGFSCTDYSENYVYWALQPTISYLPPDELELVRKALKPAFDAHDGQKRRNGEPFIIHPVEVARILGELELDWESMAAGLLHDTIEDTNVVTFERIEKDFGSTVRHIVEGETKVSKRGKLKSKNENNCMQDVKADDLRQMFLAITEEVRVIIVKLADRLHNMRTLSHTPSHKQASIALETLQVFAPLARLLGMYQIKSELENLSLVQNMRRSLKGLLCFRRTMKENYVRCLHFFQAKKILVEKIEDDQLLDLVAVRSEVRAVCNIYKAISKSKIYVNEVNQIAQLRIVIKPKPCTGIGPLCTAEQICYHVLGLVHSIWTPVPRFVSLLVSILSFTTLMKDYIATPKPNGYQSLHTTVIPFLYESMFQVEVQVRTEEMDLIAQRGIAAHYCGKVLDRLVGDKKARSLKGKSVCLNNSNIALRIGWLNAIREWQEEFVGNMSSREFVDVVTRDLLGSRVFVFTPRGEIKNLPKGATVVDYAYMIHTEIGNKMVAAKQAIMLQVNGNLVSPTHVLANAEVVEIITYKALSSKSAFQGHKQWLQHAKTRSARHKIMKFLREQAALSPEEIMADSVCSFISDSEKGGKLAESSDFSKVGKPISEEVLQILSASISPEEISLQNGSVCNPKINGSYNKHVVALNLNGRGQLLSPDHDVETMIFDNTTWLREVLPGLESWRNSKIAAWQRLEGKSIQWLCVVSIDRGGVMSEVTMVLSSLGITVCSCVAETDRGRGMGVMLFHIDGNLGNLVDSCARIDLILGVLGWSTGCTWASSIAPEVSVKHDYSQD